MSFEVEFPVFEKVCWCDYHVCIDRLAKQVATNKRGVCEQIVAIGRGGFVVGVHLSHKLDLPLIPLMHQTRDGQTNEKIVTDKHTLIVDDINDTGKTLSDVCFNNVWNGSYRVAVLVHKNHSDFQAVDYYGTRSDNDDWISFPWER